MQSITAIKGLVTLCQVHLLVKAFSLVHISSENFYRLRNPSRTLLLLGKGDAIDVEFKRSQDDEFESDIKSTILQASLNLVDPQLRIPIEFTDPISKAYIPCNLAFTFEHDGVEYSIGSPIHTQVAVFCEDDNGQSYFVDPDVDDNLELMEMAAAQFESLNNCKVVFHRTPRTLTVQGNLDELIQGWDSRQEVNPLESVNIFDDSEEDEFFDSFFSKELGDDYKEKYLVEDPVMDKKVEELMDLFTFPGFGSRKNETEGILNILKEIEHDAKIAQQYSGPEQAALRLVGFEGPDGKPYSLMKMLKPTILVAKDDGSLAPDQRLLLTKDEAKQIIPILEREFKNELAEAGF